MSHKRGKIQPSKTLATDSLNNKPEKLINTPVALSFKHIADGGSEHCISNCVKDQLLEIGDCLRQLTTLSWNQILQQGGKGGPNKTGLAYTTYQDSALRTVKRPPQLAADMKIGAVRASQAFRIFGSYKDHVFYVLWFDRQHKIVPV
jgi:hypothetical protein